MTQTATAARAYEDFDVGDQLRLGPHTVTPEQIVDFASQFDPQPMHLDEAAGKAGMLGGLSASGWHTSSIFMRMMCDAYILDSMSQGSPGIDYMRWKRPVLAGDVLSGHSTVLSKRVSGSRPELGLVTFRHQLFNQRDQLILECQNTGLLLLRNPESNS